MSTSKQTHDHEEIKEWVAQHGGVPARVKGTEGRQGQGVLRIHFPGHSNADDKLEEMDWKDFFEAFDRDKLDFLYQDKKANGEESTFHKFVERK